MNKTDLSLSLKKFSLRKASLTFWRFWVKYFHYFLFLIFVFIGGFVLNVWYRNIYQIDRDIDERNLQLEQRTREVEFNEVLFDATNERIEQRRQVMNEDAEDVNDIFFPNQLPAIAEDQKDLTSLMEASGEVPDASQDEAVSRETVEVIEDADETVDNVEPFDDAATIR